MSDISIHDINLMLIIALAASVILNFILIRIIAATPSNDELKSMNDSLVRTVLRLDVELTKEKQKNGTPAPKMTPEEFETNLNELVNKMIGE